MSDKPPAGCFRILYFASSASFTRKDSEDIPAPLPVKELFQLLESKYPQISRKVLDSCAVTLNLDYVDVQEIQALSGDSRAVIINEGDEVAIIPPVSSG